MGDKRHGGSGFGAPWRHYARVESTNTAARELAAAGAPHGTVVTAIEQTAGRGRQGRSWTAPPGRGLFFSAILRPLDPRRHATLPLAVPLAVCEAAEALNPAVECRVKWPNDVHLGGRKLAGILIEARPRDGWAVIGVGLNLSVARDGFPPELRDTATSLFPTPDGPTNPASAVPFSRVTNIRNSATVLSARLGGWVEAGPEEVLAAWRERDALIGREVEWEEGSGVADGVDERGYLLVRTADGDRVALGAGEVHLTRS